MLDHLSDEARATVLRPAVRVSYPARHDRAGWQALIESMNDQIGASMPALTALPAAVDAVDVDGISTFQARPHGCKPSADEPVYLELHGGALVYCGGPPCARITARGRGVAGDVDLERTVRRFVDGLLNR